MSKVKKLKTLKIIKIEVIIGDGTEKNPIREITQYWTLNGKLLFTIDPFLNQ